MNKGDLVSIGDSIGIITYRHPTKFVVRVYWNDSKSTWESCARLTLIFSCDDHEVYPYCVSRDGDLLI